MLKFGLTSQSIKEQQDKTCFLAIEQSSTYHSKMKAQHSNKVTHDLSASLFK